MKAKRQIVYIHGGDTFKNRREYVRYLRTRPIVLEKISWHGRYLDEQLGRRFQIIRPRMPLSDYAQYRDWKILFERYIPKLRNNVILIGGSLGGIFLAKYLSERRFPKKVLSTYLICPPYDNSDRKKDLAGGFRLKNDLSLLEKNTPRLTLFFSKNDEIVPVSHAEKYRAKLPHAKIIIYKNKNGHFRIPTFPEIVRLIRNDAKRLTR